MEIDKARQKGAMALFGEKYGDVVRVVDMGGWSVELCGGTHVDNTAKIGPFRIVSESSVASGVRRIEAVTGKAFLIQAEDAYHMLSKGASMLKTNPSELITKMESFLGEMKALRQNIDRMKDKVISGDAERFLFASKNIGGLRVLTSTQSDIDVADLRKMGDFLRDKEENVVAVLAAVNGDKVSFLAVCGKQAIARGIKAGDIIKAVSAVAGGKGGGKAESAMGGGTNVLKTDDALAIVDDLVAEKLGL
jgi:alanyl-tRNA synthetase